MVKHSLSTAAPVARLRSSALPTWLLVTLAALALFRYAYIIWGPLDLAPDEAHYWEWSRHLDLGYYSKGPMIAWLIAVGTGIAGHTELGMRLLAPFLSLLVALLAYAFTVQVWQSRSAGVIAALLFTLSPVFFIGGLVLTTDVPMVLFWLLTLWFVWLAAIRQQAWAWYAAGLATGFGLLTKLSMGLLPAAVFAYLLAQPRLRHWLRRPAPYLAALIAALCTLPMLWWNVEHGWGTFMHAGQHVREGDTSLGHWLAFLGGQLGIISPILYALVALGVWRAMRLDEPEPGRYGIILWPSLLTLAFYYGKAAVGTVNANWPVAAYVGLFIIAAGPLARLTRRAWLTGGFALAAASLAIVLSTDLLRDSGIPIPRRLDASHQMRGWSSMAQWVEQRRQQTGPAFVVSDTYQTASSLAFYLPDHPQVYNVNFGGRRFNQYDFWPDFENRRGQNAILVMEGRHPAAPPQWQQRFDACAPAQHFAAVTQGVTWREYTLVFCRNYQGGDWPRPERY